LEKKNMKRKIKVIGNAAVPSKPVLASGASDIVYQTKLKACQRGSEIFPLDSPGLPPLPLNSMFLTNVQALGDTNSKIEENVVKQEDGTKKVEKKLIYSDQLYNLVRAALRQPGFTLPVEVGPFQTKPASFVSGQLFNNDTATGPRPSDVMIIGKMPWLRDVQQSRCMNDNDGVLLRNTFQAMKLPIAEFSKYYVTNLVKFMPPDFKNTLKAVWIKDCLHLLHQELKIVQPKFILCLGADASKALLGTSAGVNEMEGRIESFRYNVAFSEKDKEHRWREAKIMTVVSPRQVLREQSSARQFEQGVARFINLVKNPKLITEEKVDHRVIDNYGDLLETLLSIESEMSHRLVAVDAEWHGQHPVNAGSYMRTVQFSWAPQKAVGIKLHEPGGQPTPGFSGSVDEVTDRGILTKAITLLTTFFCGGEIKLGPKTVRFKPKRVVGHFFNADLEWLLAYGINIQNCFRCPLFDYEMKEENKDKRLFKLYAKEGFAVGSIVPAWFRTSFEGGADTGLMAHAIEETASYKLETLAMRYTTAPRYDNHLQKWKLDYCRDAGLKSGDLEGYGECPDSVLLPYGMYDADVTLRLYYKLNVLLDDDYEGNSCREAFWESQIATPAVLEIHQTGITVDRDRIDFLTSKFKAARDKLEANMRHSMRWPDFNIRSTQHVREFLFGHELNGRVDKLTGKALRLRPADAFTLKLTPICDTSKPPKPWKEISSAKKLQSSPSTNKQSLSLLAQSCPNPWQTNYVNQLRDYRFLDQVLKTVLRPPVKDESTDEDIINEDGNFEYEDGLASMCCDDGKVRTHIYQTKETGRWSSARPNLQNISKQRDPDYKRLLGDDYKYSLRSVLKASPGHVLVEADYVGAELFGMAVMAGDANMIKHATKNQLPEDHPDYYDIHSNVAVSAFKLKCPPTKTGLAEIGKKSIRIVAKSVIFGIAYGRGARAISQAAKEQGIDVTVDEAQAVISAIFEMYPRLEPFFAECQKRASGIFDEVSDEPGNYGMVTVTRFLCNCFGRFRRFPDSKHDGAMMAEFGRQAMNFPIQSMIASAVSRALAYIHNYKRTYLNENGVNLFNVLLQIHDAILLEVPYEHVKHVCEYVFPTYMRDAVPIYPSQLDGLPTGEGPYYLGIEAEVMRHWGEALSFDEAEKLGIPTGKGGAKGCVVNYSKGKK